MAIHQQNGNEWLGLGEASRALGVNESTLRRWADSGLVRTFRTPGGHRRFAVADLNRIVAAAEKKGAPHFDGEAVEHIRQLLDRDADVTLAWMHRMASPARATLGELGRETVTLAEHYLAPDAARTDLEAQAATIGQRYGSVLHEAGVALPNAVAAFAYFRHGMDEVVRSYAQTHGMSADAAGDVWERLSLLEDRILVSLSGTYTDGASPTGVSSQSEDRS